eukprot:scaffold2244_cov363-Pavlova_lutheri.AAC.3
MVIILLLLGLLRELGWGPSGKRAELACVSNEATGWTRHSKSHLRVGRTGGSQVSKIHSRECSNIERRKCWSHSTRAGSCGQNQNLQRPSFSCFLRWSLGPPDLIPVLRQLFVEPPDFLVQPVVLPRVQVSVQPPPMCSERWFRILRHATYVSPRWSRRSFASPSVGGGGTSFFPPKRRRMALRSLRTTTRSTVRRSRKLLRGSRTRLESLSSTPLSIQSIASSHNRYLTRTYR